VNARVAIELLLDTTMLNSNSLCKRMRWYSHWSGY